MAWIDLDLGTRHVRTWVPKSNESKKEVFYDT